MKHLLALLSLTAFGLSHAPITWSQTDCPSPYDEPDSNGYSTINAAYFDTDGSGTVDVPDLMNLLSAYGVVVAQAFACGDPVSYQGYDYATVLIGDQCWFAENLRSENYDNGDAIPAALSDSDWSSTISGATAVYGEGSSVCNTWSNVDACDPLQSLNEFGRLYNWYAVDDSRGLCPIGWHVPTDGEWTVMTDFLGGENVAGGQMKTVWGWSNGGNGTNSSGFSGLPGGFRNASGDFKLAGIDGRWWSSSPDGSVAWNRTLFTNDEEVHRNAVNQRGGFSVRCVRDAE